MWRRGGDSRRGPGKPIYAVIPSDSEPTAAGSRRGGVVPSGPYGIRHALREACCPQGKARTPSPGVWESALSPPHDRGRARSRLRAGVRAAAPMPRGQAPPVVRLPSVLLKPLGHLSGRRGILQHRPTVQAARPLRSKTDPARIQSSGLEGGYTFGVSARAAEFPFVAGQPSLDFLNTRPVVKKQPVELLSTLEDFVRWLGRAGAIDSRAAADALRRWGERARGRPDRRAGAQLPGDAPAHGRRDREGPGRAHGGPGGDQLHPGRERRRPAPRAPRRRLSHPLHFAPDPADRASRPRRRGRGGAARLARPASHPPLRQPRLRPLFLRHDAQSPPPVVRDGDLREPHEGPGLPDATAAPRLAAPATRVEHAASGHASADRAHSSPLPIRRSVSKL